MLNEKKIRLMTKLAMFEEKEGKKELKIDKFYKIDYIRSEIFKTILCTTIGYLLILLTILVYKSEYIMQRLTTLNYRRIALYTLVIYILLLVVYVMITTIISFLRYDAAKKKMKKYKKNLKTLRLFYKEESGLK